jgi:hypothetical protein
MFDFTKNAGPAPIVVPEFTLPKPPTLPAYSYVPEPKREVIEEPKGPSIDDYFYNDDEDQHNEVKAPTPPPVEIPKPVEKAPEFRPLETMERPQSGT